MQPGDANTRRLYAELVAAANKAMTEGGLPAWAVKLMAERLVDDLTHIPEGMSATMEISDKEGEVIAGGHEGIPAQGVIRIGETQRESVIDFKERKTYSRPVDGHGDGAELLRLISKHLH